MKTNKSNFKNIDKVCKKMGLKCDNGILTLERTFYNSSNWAISIENGKEYFDLTATNPTKIDIATTIGLQLINTNLN